jgi:hypothetical protein
MPQIEIPAMAQRPSGLWAPSSRPVRASPEGAPDGTLLVAGDPPSDLDAMWVAPSPEALGISPIPRSKVEALVSDLPFAPSMIVLSALTGCVWAAGMDRAAQLALAEELYGEERPILRLLRSFAAEEARHVLFSEQHLVALMRLLIAGAGPSEESRNLTEAEIDSLLMALVGIGSYRAGPDGASETSAEASDWVGWLIRSGLYFDRSNLGSDQGRARALFVSLFEETDRDGPDWCDLAGWMAQDVGSFEDQLAFGYAMGMFARALEEDLTLAERFVLVSPEGLLAGQLPPETTARMVGAISATRDELASEFTLAGVSEDHIMWDRAPFERRPFLQLDDGRMLLMSPRFLHSWMGAGFYYRLLDSASRRAPTSGRSTNSSLRFTRFHGELMEKYVVRLTIDSHQTQIRAGAARVVGEQIYAGRDGSESKSPDVVLSYATEVVAIEVTGGRPPRRARVSGEPAVVLEVVEERVIGKMRELDHAIDDILDGLVRIDGVDLALVRCVWPVVVVPSTILQTDLLWRHIEAAAPGLFAREGVQPPTLLSIEDYERALGVVEQGQGLPWLLASRLGSVYRTMPPSHFLHRRFRGLARPRFLDSETRLAGERARGRLFGEKEA